MTSSDSRAPAQRLRALRFHLGLSQRELAHEFGVSSPAIALWENGQRAMPGPALRLLSLYERELTPHRRPPATAAGDAKLSSRVHLRRTATSFGALLWFGLSQIFRDAGSDASIPDSITARVRRAAIRRYVEELGKLKGLSMKLGQMIGYMSFVLPEELQRALAELPAHARPTPAVAVATAVLEELGRLPVELFRSWTPTPFAVASIGQVHAATTWRNERVAVKVQHAKIVESIVSDLKHVELVDRVYCLLFRGQTPGVMHQEMSARILEECDYTIEARNQEDFRAIFQHRADVVVPRVLPELSSRRVLTTELAGGRSFEQLAARGTQPARDAAAATLFGFFWTACLRHGLYQTDPYPGNFLFEESRVVFLDFGRVQRFTPGFVPRWRALFRALCERDRERLVQIYLEMKSIAAPERYDMDVGYRSLVACFLPCLVEDQPFHFTAELIWQSWRMFIRDNVNLSYIDFTPDMVLLHQIQFGLSSLLVRLDARVRCRDIFLDLIYEPGAPRPPPFRRDELELLGVRAGGSAPSA